MKTTKTIIILMLFCGWASAQSWQPVGPDERNQVSYARAYYTSIAINSSGTPYVVFQDYLSSSKATVRKFNGSSWETVGSAGFSAGSADYTSIAIRSDGTPYVVYRDNGSKATVMKFDGSNWVTVGSAGFSAGRADFTSIAIRGIYGLWKQLQSHGNEI
jgi:hypothetical protein